MDLKNDFDDWQEFNEATIKYLRENPVEGKVIIYYLMKPSFHSWVRVVFFVEKSEQFKLDVAIWNQQDDAAKMLNLLEKVKMFGNFKPAIQCSVTELNPNQIKQILNLIQQIVKAKIEYEHDNIIGLDGVYHELEINYGDIYKKFDWHSFPKKWNLMIELSNILIEFSTLNKKSLSLD